MWVARRVIMSKSRAGYRLKILSRHHVMADSHITIRRCKSNDSVSIGNVSIKLLTAANPQKVPTSYLPGDVSHSLLQHLKWMMQKDLLGQDIFLIGCPGPMRRRLALMYLEMTNREHEYIALSRDTTEADLKQRREIKGGTAYYVDQCAVRAATEGRVLVLEGIEKAERNVLPVLNNLLENREMQLEDGRFLMKASTYDKLLDSHSKEEMNDWKIVRVSEAFRVIALGLPIPRYTGNPLDPPLRSRFQARDINNIPFKEQFDVLRGTYSSLDPSYISEILSFAHTLNQEEGQNLGLADFPLASMTQLSAIMSEFSHIRGESAVKRLYPYNLFLSDDGKKSIKSTLETFELHESSFQGPNLQKVSPSSENSEEAMITFTDGHSFSVKKGQKELQSNDEHYVQTEHQERLISDLLTSHRFHDFCIVGPRGCGKTTVVRKLSTLLGYHVEPILLYQDMTSRDLLQQRTTLENGDTAWRPSPLLTAMKHGDIAVLDGLHRINAGTFSVLASLIQDRELNLADGSRFLQGHRFDTLAQDLGKTSEELNEIGVHRIHPSFRIIGLAEPPDLSSTSGQWLNAEMLSMFLFHHMTALPIKDEVKVIDSLTANHVTDKLFDLSESLRRNRDPTFQALANTLSTRNLLRIARRLSRYPSESLYEAVHSACMSRFLPALAKRSLEQMLEELDIAPSGDRAELKEAGLERATSCTVKGDILRIGNTECHISKSDNLMKVPDTLFYDNSMHIAVMESMLKDYLCGEHLLLVGNQGVGKNKVVDRFLQLLGRPREYIQLHRDTTVQTLTLQPTVRDGKIVYDDSPLVKAVREGLVLVIDEADKAPTNVTCVLKTLVESGQMHLSDGRKIVSDETDASIVASAGVIHMHPNFRMIVLANRPGFPFLGNDFFHAVGDIFSCHALDNPDVEGEVSMLRQYGKDVPEDTLRKLVFAFGELRNLADQGTIAYPYSTREVVNIVKHLQVFPDDGLATVVSNVFDFDQYNTEMKETIISTMHKHGIPLGASVSNVSLAKEYALPPFSKCSPWNRNKVSKTNNSLVSVENRRLKVKGPVQALVKVHPVVRKSARSTHFTELESYWTLPLFSESSHICDVTSSHGLEKDMATLHFVGVNPAVLYSMKSNGHTVSCLDLYDAFPTHRNRYQPSLSIACLGASLPHSVLLHEQVGNVLLVIDTENGRYSRLETGGLLDSVTDAVSRRIGTRPRKPVYRMCTDLLQEGSHSIVTVYEISSPNLAVVDVLEGTCSDIQLPLSVNSVRMPSANHWMIEDKDRRQYLLEKNENDYSLSEITCAENSLPSVVGTSIAPLHTSTIQAVTGQVINVPNRLLATKTKYADLVLGFPDLQEVEVYSAAREDDLKSAEVTCLAVLPATGQIIRSLPGHRPPQRLSKDGHIHERNVSGYLEVTDLLRQKLRYLKVSGAAPSPYSTWLTTASGPMLSPLPNDGLVTVDSGGGVQLWETSQALLDSALQGWTKLIGTAADDLQMTYERDGVKDCQAPKHGKVDPTGNPHVGGNTWAGGTGGRDTAGLGGVGGPYRLDAGHDVHQVSQEVKDAVPEHIREAAREMGQKAFKERLKQIQMSEYDAEVYHTFYDNVRRHIQSMRVVLDSLQAKGKERQWLKNQTHGDLDDGRIIEGLTGERNIYRKRGEKEPEPGSPQTKPKRLRLLVDVSGSMYRFNGHDLRLQREMEVVCMVLEAFHGYDEKLKYDIYGHSGESHSVSLTTAEDPPKNNKQRLQVLQTMHAHSQFCLSGDFTLKATRAAIEEISKEDADEHFVIVLSDANFDRYGIPASSFAEVLSSKDNVNAYAIFIGSLGDQADRLVKALPSGHSFACMDTAKLPQIIQQIFTSTFLK
ncbi:von Willebrand factor A domain-containing protein 8-like [Watersipora subatra]|uniref:von Willebrand factor A domain-containing protein 8-like n=1 Tax=Watersipora subatra TaxID=2589382 RepID=UPI00355B2E82